MSKTHLEFYSTPDEQREWLQKQVSDLAVWVVLWTPGRDCCYYPPGNLNVTSLKFNATNADEIMLFLGCKELAEKPGWRESPHGNEIDFKKSRTIQFIPSLVVGEILLEGRLAIMRELEYEQDGIDPKPLFRWYRQVVKSLASIKAPEAVITQQTSLGDLKEFPSVVVSLGAIKWRCKGRRLKQFPGSAVEFDVKVT